MILSRARKKVPRLAPTIATAIMMYARYARPCVTVNNGIISVRKFSIVVTVIAITTPHLLLVYGLLRQVHRLSFNILISSGTSFSYRTSTL